MDKKQYIERISHRSDIALRLSHLTRGENQLAAYENLLKILKDKKVKANNGYVVGQQDVVCFQEAPMNSIAENLIYEKLLRKELNSQVIRYSAFGLRFDKSFIFGKGGRPVIYGKSEELKKILPREEWWRIVNMNLKGEEIIDWSHEREWRIKGDLEFVYSNVEVIVSSEKYYKKFVKQCLEEGMEEMLYSIKGIITLSGVCF